MRSLYWFQHDLRLADNPGLLAQANNCDELLLLYCWNDARPWCNLSGMGQQRRRFLLESLQALQRDLATKEQHLLIVNDHPARVLPALVKTHRLASVATARVPGYYERKTLEALADKLPVPLSVYRGNTLFDEDQLPGPLSSMPQHYSPFKRQVEQQTPNAPLAPPATLPPPPSSARYQAATQPTVNAHPALAIRGGAAEGQRRLQHWVFTQHGIAQYKETRNALDALTGSSTLSPWLANGCLSPREVAAAVFNYEQRFGSNESSHWLWLELLWREFFHWRALRDDISLFRARGDRQQRGKRRLCTFQPRDFARWCQGDTDFPLVNACMRQLLATGWMSNRGRQLTASCLINELGIDWRYGAAFFEQQLIDFDVASNYGNWQYIAGVGADPRGGRHFDLAQQAARYDPEQQFTQAWGGLRPTQPRYVVDAADWPLYSPESDKD
jgi:deoxyribodipyrimidine photo-lyase